jgi:hypothetical protein
MVQSKSSRPKFTISLSWSLKLESCDTKTKHREPSSLYGGYMQKATWRREVDAERSRLCRFCDPRDS